MTESRIYLSVFALLCLLNGGCGNGLDELPERHRAQAKSNRPVQGKGDVVDSSTLDSQFVRDGVDYWDRRPISLLEDLGALTPLQSSVAHRVDGIIENEPQNGVLDVYELAASEQQNIWGTFFEDEQNEFAYLWSLMEMPTSEVTIDIPTQPILTDVSPGFDSVPGLLISSLRTDLRRPAQRLQRVQDADLNPDTVDLEDITWVMENQQGFTSSEIDLLDEVRQEIERRAPVAMGGAVAELSALGAANQPPLLTTGVEVNYMAVTKLFKKASVLDGGYSPTTIHPVEYYTKNPLAIGRSLQMHTLYDIEFSATSGGTIVLNGAHPITRVSEVQGFSPAKPLLVEIWRGGQVEHSYKIFSSANTLKVGNRITSYSQFFDFDIRLPDGTPLIANLVETIGDPNGELLDPFGGYYATWEFDIQSHPTPMMAHQVIADAFDAAATTLAPGLYLIAGDAAVPTLDEHVLEVRSPRVMYLDGVRMKLGRIGGTVDGMQNPLVWYVTTAADNSYGGSRYMGSPPYLFEDGRFMDEERNFVTLTRQYF